ncbi:MAG: 30S ribosome-binding factor RbfA [Bacteroidales bacterium]|nr:30S ribosome-binding factor RbfA [Bacteroidales bacterium]
METTRQNKIARLIQKDLASIFQAQTRQTKNLLVSVSVVRVSPDLSVAKAYLSIFPSAKAQEVLQSINDHAAQIRYELGGLERHQLRIIPELKFFLDDSLDYVEHIDELLKPRTDSPSGTAEEEAGDASEEEKE